MLNDREKERVRALVYASAAGMGSAETEAAAAIAEEALARIEAYYSETSFRLAADIGIQAAVRLSVAGKLRGAGR